MAPSLGHRIRTARNNAGLTREQLGAQIGVNWRTVARYENDETQEISYVKLAAIAKATSKPLAYFVGKVAA